MKTSLPPTLSETIGVVHLTKALPRVLRQIKTGKSFVITKSGKAVAELRPVESPKSRFKWGDMEGRIRIADDFCEPIEEMKPYME